MSWSAIVAGATPYDESQAMPSRTRSIRTMYEPGLAGAFTITVAATLCPGATSLGSVERSPSHDTTAPSPSARCAATCSGLGPPALHVARPSFLIVTGRTMRPPGCSGVSGLGRYDAL